LSSCLATDEWLLPQALKEAGYQTAIVGKWHLGHFDQKYWPSQRGFDYSYGPLIGEIDHFKHESHGVTDWYRNNKLVKEPGYDSELFGADAVRVINSHDTKSPLFLYLAFTAPHTPYQAPQNYLDMYKDIADPSRRAYAAQITAMDDQIGKVVGALEQRKMRDNTLIFFVSDNGGTRSSLFVGEAAVKGELPPNNGPYRDGKGSVYEGGTRVVALANWPGRIKPGTVDGMMHIVDIYPSLTALAGTQLGKNKPLDGLDVWPAISEASPVRGKTWCTMLSHIAPGCVRAIGSWFGRRCCRCRSSFSICRKIPRKRPISPISILTRSRNCRPGRSICPSRLCRPCF
jgi:arylsulfatase I/J